MTTLVIVGVAATAVGAGVLALSVAAKLADWEATRLVWPIRGWAGRLAGPGVITVMEAALVVAALAPLPPRLRMTMVGLVFAAYAAAALALRGESCGCFGSWLPTRFNLTHVAGCLMVAVLCISAALAGGPPPPAATLSAAVAAGLAAAGVTAVVVKRRARSPAGRATTGRRDAPLPPAEAIARVVVYTSASCGFCRALEAQAGRYEAMAGCPLEFHPATTEADKDAAGGAFPAAVAYEAGGAAVYGPVHGLSPIRDLLRHTATAPSRS